MFASRMPDEYWCTQANRLDWFSPWQKLQVVDNGGPRQRWFVGGMTNLCHNALDRHIAQFGDKTAIIHIAADGAESRVSYRELMARVLMVTQALLQRGVKRGDRVMICLPVGALAVAAMLACTRLGAIHVVVTAMSTATGLRQRIVACDPQVLLCHAATVCLCQESATASLLLMLTETLADSEWQPCEPMPADAPSHILFTSGTTGTPKGIVRDTGGYAVALLASLDSLFQFGQDDVFFTTADIGWVTGHSYGVYAPLLAGATTVFMTPSAYNAPGQRWWTLLNKLGVTHLLTIPGAMRLARQQGAPQVALPQLRGLFLAGEPLDVPTSDGLLQQGLPVKNHYWQTESGWPLLAGEGTHLLPVRPRQLEVRDENTGLRCEPGEAGMLVVRDTLGPGGMLTLWREDIDHDQRYWRYEAGSWLYVTHDRAVQFDDGSMQLLGRMDDVINVGGKRLSTVEIEQAVQDLDEVIEVVAVRLPHAVLGEIPGLYIVTEIKGINNLKKIKKRLIRRVQERCGRYALVRRVWFVSAIPKTFSGKALRREMAGQ